MQFVKGRAHLVYGSRGPVIPGGTFTETEVRALLRLLDILPHGLGWGLPMGGEWDPLRFIRVVNRLQGLGKSRALAVLNEFGRVVSAPRTPEERFDKVWTDCGRLVMSGLSCVLFGGDHSEPDLPSAGFFGIDVVAGVPFMLRHGGGGGYNAGFGIAHLVGHRLRGRLMSNPLTPPPRPWELVDRVPPPPGTSAPAARWMAMNQVLRLLTNVYPIPADRLGNLIADGPSLERRWREMTGDLKRLTLAWDVRRSCYASQP